jgi:hypothetical protein
MSSPVVPPSARFAPARGDTAALEVIARAASVIAVPKAGPSNSFVLHAPLELMARVGLLPFVPAERRADALAMIDWLREEYEGVGEPADESVEMWTPAERRLVGRSVHELLGESGEGLVTSLAAAGHAPIGVALLRRVGATLPAGVLPVTLLRGAVRAIEAQPEWQVRWHRDTEGLGAVNGTGDPRSLYAAVRATPRLGRPRSDFIHPLMSQVQDRGVAAELLGPVLAERFDTAQAGRVLARVGSWSMVHDDPDHAPYGWSHSLTMPQAVMALAGAGVSPRTALAVAATYTVGFRAAYGRVDLPEVMTPGDGPKATVPELALAASLHEDAHLVKFTLACLHAAADDPAFAALHLRAAERLAQWWGA